MKAAFLRLFLLVAVLVGGIGSVSVVHAESATVQQARPTLRRESRGDAVRELQRLLNAWIAREQSTTLQPLPITGYFGALTDRTVRTFQGAKNLAVDGIVGPRTWAALDAAPPATFAPIMDRDSGFLLGAARGSAWLNDETAAPLITGDVTYRLYTATGAAGTFTGGVPRAADVPCEEAFEIATPLSDAPTNAIGVAGDWNAMPRVPQAISLDSSVYRDAVGALLRERGIANPDVRLTGAWRVDMDGDGRAEVILSASRRAEGTLTPNASAGDYSIIAVRTVVNGAVQTIVVADEVYPEAVEFNAPLDFTVLAPLDLNGDGRMELVIDADYYEGFSTKVYTINGTTSAEVLSSGCGV